MPNTAKQEAIRKAYGEYWHSNLNVQHDGSVPIGLISKDNLHNELQKAIEYVFPGFLTNEIDIETIDSTQDGYFDVYIRPKSLQGIETNNGWIRIESEEDLPKEDGVYWVYTVDGNRQLRYLEDFLHNGKINKYFTHYQPILKPEKPIY